MRPRISVTGFVRRSVRRSVMIKSKSGKSAFPPPPTRPQLMAVYPALFIFKNFIPFFIKSLCQTALALYQDLNMSANKMTLWWNEGKLLKKRILRDKTIKKQVQCADPSHYKWIPFHVFPILYVVPTLKTFRVWQFQLYTSLYWEFPRLSPFDF